MKKIILVFCFLTTFLSISAQDLSLVQSFTVKIEHEKNVPVVFLSDDDTVNVVFTEQYITEIFSKYKVYSFEKMFPDSSSETLKKYYSFTCNSRAIINELVKNVSEDILYFQYSYEEKGINKELKTNFINPERYKIESFAYSSEEPCLDRCNFISVKPEKIFTVEVFYDKIKDELVFKSIGKTYLDVEFEYRFKEYAIGSHNLLGIWETSTNKNYLKISDEDSTNPEFSLYGMIIGNFGVKFQKVDDNTLIIRANNMIFGEDVFKFSSKTLSVEEEDYGNYLDILKNPIQNTLQLSLDNDNTNIRALRIYDVSGKLLINKEKNFLNTNTSNLSKGLYFLQIHLENNMILRKKLLKN